MLFMFSIAVALAATISWSYNITSGKFAKITWGFVAGLWLISHLIVLVVLLVIWLVWVNRWRFA